MRIGGETRRTVWPVDGESVEIIDQTALPHDLVIRPLRTLDDAARGDPHDAGARRAADRCGGGLWHGAGRARGRVGRGLSAAAQRCCGSAADGDEPALGAGDGASRRLRPLPPRERAAAACAEAERDRRGGRRGCRAIGDHGAGPVRGLRARQGGAPVNVLTHCNAGWLATVDWGTALAPIYAAHDAGLPIHVWVDETRPRNQGAALTAWELDQHGVAAHRHRRQRRRPPDAAAARSTSCSSAPIASTAARRRVQQDRHLPEGAGGARQRRAVLRRRAVLDHRLASRRRPATKFPSRSAPPAEVTARHRPDRRRARSPRSS